MMWGSPPFHIPDSCVVDVRDLAAARVWYKEKLGLQESHVRREDDSGRPFVDLCLSKHDEACLVLVELKPGTSPEKRHNIFYAKKLEKAREWLAERGLPVEAIETDSGGNRLFRFYDLDGNAIEVCVEPA
jgi:catechol 2,3-dioxygenase-like lactoylglutathione lyase family enzyme